MRDRNRGRRKRRRRPQQGKLGGGDKPTSDVSDAGHRTMCTQGLGKTSHRRSDGRGGGYESVKSWGTKGKTGREGKGNYCPTGTVRGAETLTGHRGVLRKKIMRAQLE